MALGEGDSAALSGALTIGTWTDKDGSVRPSLNLQAHVVLTAYHVTRKRQAVAQDNDGPEQRTPAFAGDLSF